MSTAPSCPHLPVCAAVPAGAHFRAVAAHAGLDALRALVVSARTAGVAALRAAALRDDEARALHQRLAAEGIESLVVATCNRTELYWRARIPGDDTLTERLFAAAVRATTSARRLHGTAAAEHLLRVASGLDSVVLGEAEILGQLRGALDASPHAGAFLAGLARAALRTGRMARAETRIGVGAQSVASAAVRLLADRLPLEGRRVAVIGAGATGLKVARHLRALGVGQLVLVNRTVARAADHAVSLSAEVAPLSALAEHLATADAVVGAADAPDPLVTTDMLHAAVHKRSGRVLVTVDLSMPPAIANDPVPGVERLDLASVDRHVAGERERRGAEVPRVEAVIARELGFLRAWARQQALRPLVADLRRKADDIRQREIARLVAEAGGNLDVPTLDRLARRLLDRLVALPVASLEQGHVPLDPVQTQYVRRLFGLHDGDPA